MAKVKQQSTPGDMVRSLAVLLIPLVLIAAWFSRTPDDHPVEQVDWQPVLTTARAQAPFPVLAPVNLPPSWVPVRVTWESTEAGEAANRWRFGWLDPQQLYFAVEQSDAAAGPFIDDVARSPQAEGTSTVGKATWQRQISDDGRTRSLVWVDDQVTTIVSADASYEALEAFAATLSAGEPS